LFSNQFFKQFDTGVFTACLTSDWLAPEVKSLPIKKLTLG